MISFGMVTVIQPVGFSYSVKFSKEDSGNIRVSIPNFYVNDFVQERKKFKKCLVTRKWDSKSIKKLFDIIDLFVDGDYQGVQTITLKNV